jgi:hypothetical protein
MPTTSPARTVPEAGEELAAWARSIREQEPDDFVAAQRIARRLGATWTGDRVEIGFWAPQLVETGTPDEHVALEVLLPPDGLDLSVPDQEVVFRRAQLPVVADGEYRWAVLEGVQPGTRDRVGALYQLVWQDDRGHRHVILDVVAHSLPFGAFGPAEVYDMAGMQAARGDGDYYAALADRADAQGVVRFDPPTNILQLHVPTATTQGTVGALAEQFRSLGEALRTGRRLTGEEEVLAGYQALQPLPLEPTIEYELGPRAVQRVDEGPADAPEVTLRLRRPDMTNWGYDIVLAGSSATNPALLADGRPDEVVDLAAALHSLPEPMMLVLDVVYGHTDNQALSLLPSPWFRGPNMYGQDVNQQHPVVRALMLEMQRRKVDLGADGVRVDGAQDFKTWDAAKQVVAHDDDFLALMSQVEQSVHGVRYLPWFVFEDGRPWPREDWPVASTYRAVIDQQPDAFQWGPITFAHNTPALHGFWDERWWRVEQIFTIGSHWISGSANHDTVRRGTQIPLDEPVNPALGDTLPQILGNAYDNAGAQMLTYAAFPGVPMDFLNATARAPWGFIRNTDDRYGVKIVAEESLFLWWQVDEERWSQPGAFARLRELGLGTLEDARAFFAALARCVEAAGDDLTTAAELMATVAPRLPGPEPTTSSLKQVARAFMDDAHHFCSVPRWLPSLDPARTAFNRSVREFRHSRPWLREDAGPQDRYGHTTEDGAFLAHSLRHGPDGEQVLLVVNLAGDPVDVVCAEVPDAPFDAAGWRPALLAPGVEWTAADAPLHLADSQGVVLVRRP